jgi:hypothetical protein
MVIVWGTRLYGKVDHVPGLFYVATHFAYVQFIPLFPTSSYLILDGTEGSQGFQGVKIPMNGKSVLVGYLRAALLVLGLVLIGLGIAEMSRDKLVGAALIVAGLACGLFFLLSYKLTRPGPQRAVRLAREAGIAPEVVAKYFLDANLISEDQVQLVAEEHARGTSGRDGWHGEEEDHRERPRA